MLKHLSDPSCLEVALGLSSAASGNISEEASDSAAIFLALIKHYSLVEEIEYFWQEWCELGVCVRILHSESDL